MKVHPSSNKRNITVRYDFNSQSTAGASICRQKKLRRLPHIFGKLLELPFYSDADVSIHETSESLRFVVDTDDDIGTDIAAHTVEICPGVIKVVVRNEGSCVASGVGVGDGDLSLWRFRLPEYTQAELATAAFSDGELVVTVPKDVNLQRNEGVWGEGNGTGSGRFVLFMDYPLNLLALNYISSPYGHESYMTLEACSCKSSLQIDYISSSMWLTSLLDVAATAASFPLGALESM
ncbi:hypothetical protein QVD17_17139 [Tagetes erecta]|uniref:SHSP domain-containing protein n=1 Tax=Tagetes erecta TaxID=13708 RepID=A0AAD8KXU6_TARER|nr:hypothetical protein QVD17_17139 [Tagetes erecta]